MGKWKSCRCVNDVLTTPGVHPANGLGSLVECSTLDLQILKSQSRITMGNLNAENHAIIFKRRVSETRDNVPIDLMISYPNVVVRYEHGQFDNGVKEINIEIASLRS